MKLSRLVLLAFLALSPLFAATAKAQTSVYASLDATQYGFSSGNTGTFSYSPGSGTYSYYKAGVGFEGSATYLFPSRSRLKAGIDLRGMDSPGTRGGAGGFGALRIAFVPNRNPVSPYFQIGGGVLSTTVVSSSPGFPRVRINGGALDLNFGLNIRVNSNFAVRALEIGGLAGSNVAFSSIGAGVIYMLPHH
jgi:hypothetical protein